MARGSSYTAITDLLGPETINVVDAPNTDGGTKKITATNIAASTVMTARVGALAAPIPVLYLPGTAGNYVSAPDSAGLSITGTLELVSRQSMDWTSGGLQAVATSKWGTGAAGDWLLICSSNALGYYDFSKYPTSVGSAAMGRTANVTYWTKMTHNTATGVVSFYTAADSLTEPTAWTLISSTGATTGVRGDSVSAAEVGSYAVGVGAPTTGKIYRSIVRNGIGGTVAGDYNGTLSPGQRQRDSAGNIWTTNGSAWSVTAG